MRLWLLCCVFFCCLAIGEREAVSAPPAPPEVTYSIVGITLGLPYAAVGLVPLIGNLVVLPGERTRSVRLGWGIFGIVIGAIGVVGSLALLGDFALAASGAGGPPFGAVPYLLAPFLVGAAATGLGIANVIKAGRSPRGPRFSLPPGKRLSGLLRAGEERSRVLLVMPL